MLKDNNLSFKNATLIASGSGNVSIYAMEKAIKLGAKVIACSDSNGYIYDKNGIDLEAVKQIKEVDGDRIHAYLKGRPEAKYFDGCDGIRSEEHTSELQSRGHLVC